MKRDKINKNREEDEKIFKNQLTYMHDGCIVSTVSRS